MLILEIMLIQEMKKMKDKIVKDKKHCIEKLDDKYLFNLSNRKVNGTIETKLPAFVMGIVNVTPDSFWEKSRGSLDHAKALIDEGADILDIGGESTRPGSEYVSEDEELRRVIPLVEEIRKFSDIPISIDTRKKRVMELAFAAGADILNDVSALEDDPDMGVFAAKANIPVILMHKRGIPSDMQLNTNYENVFFEVQDYLFKRIDYALSCGIDKANIILDPGIGFGKNLKSNSILINRCGELCDGDYPVLMALSRKTCIGEMTGKDVADRLYGTLAANLISVIKGACIIRVHDVASSLDTLKVLKDLWNI